MKKEQYTVIDLFAGCGGLSLGLYQAGWNGIFAVEKNPNAFETLNYNLIERKQHFAWPEWLPVGPLNILDINKKYKKQLGKLRGHIDLVAGGPPCQGFHLEIVALLDPRGEQVVIGDEITTFALHEFHNVWIILRELRKIVLSEVTGFQAHQLGFGKELIKDETKNVILVFVRLNLGTHLIGGFPNLRSELLLIHLSLLIAAPANQCTAPRVTAHLP